MGKKAQQSDPVIPENTEIIPDLNEKIDPAVEQAVIDAYDHALIRLILGKEAQMRFFATLVTRLRPAVANWLPTAGTDGRSIYMNPSFWMNLSLEERQGVLAHEVMHIVEQHSARQQGRDHFKFNIACFPAGTLLPGNVPIESVADMVTPFDGELIEIVHQAGKLSATPEHPVFVRKRKSKVGKNPVTLLNPDWCPISQIKVGDYVCVPKLERYGLRDDTKINLSSYILASFIGRSRGNRAVKSIPLNEDTAWLIGLYVAEGSASPSVCFSLGSHETHLVNRIKTIVSAIGYSASVSINGTSMAVNLGTTLLGRWLKDNVGDGAKNKHIPDVILRHSNPKIRKAFLEGVVDGDGHTQVRDGKDWNMVGVASPSLIRDIVLLLAQESLGAHVSTQILGPRWIGESYTEVPTVIYNVYWNPNGASYSTRQLNGKKVTTRHTRWKSDEYGVWYPVKKIDHQRYTGDVYNLVNTDDHTYVVESVLVHNCDLEINPIIREAGLKLPSSVCMPREGKFANLKLDEIAETYYNQLTDKRLASMFSGSGDAKDPGGCGGFLPTGQTEAERSKVAADWDVAVRQAAQVAKDAQKNRQAGNMPAYFEKLLERLLKPPKVPWTAELRQFFIETNRDDYTWATPNRRYIASGLYLPSLFSQHLGEIMMFVDLSGSMMGGDDLARCATEMTAILECLPSKVRIAYHDTEVKNVQEWNRYDGPIKFIGKGGGGTDHRPCFKWMEDNDVNPCVCIFFTDLETSFPKDPPPFPVFWVTVHGGNAPFGRVLEI